MSAHHELLVVGASWGGLEAVGRLLSALPPGFRVPVVIVQHRAADSRGRTLEAMLSVGASMPIVEIDDKQPIEPAHAYLAPADYHVVIEPGYFSLSLDERVQHARPSIDVALESAADSYGSRLVAAILTGANEDGAAGLARVRAAGGVTVVQDPATAVKATMPQAAIDAGGATKVLPLDEIPRFLTAVCAPEEQPA